MKYGDGPPAAPQAQVTAMSYFPAGRLPEYVAHGAWMTDELMPIALSSCEIIEAMVM